MFYTYVLYSRRFNRIYIGQTNNLDRRLEEHNLGLSKFTKKFLPWQLVYSETFETRLEAMKREKQLKTSRGRDFIREQILSNVI